MTDPTHFTRLSAQKQQDDQWTLPPTCLDPPFPTGPPEKKRAAPSNSAPTLPPLQQSAYSGFYGGVQQDAHAHVTSLKHELCWQGAIAGD